MKNELDEVFDPISKERIGIYIPEIDRIDFFDDAASQGSEDCTDMEVESSDNED